MFTPAVFYDTIEKNFVRNVLWVICLLPFAAV